jgi:2-haloacid dehalogenase
VTGDRAMSRPAAIVFDAFGTLFGLDALRTRTRTAASHEGDELFAAFKTRLIPWTWHVTVSEAYEPFPVVAAKAVMGAAREAHFPIERRTADWIVEGLRELPPFDDVPAGLKQLADAGIPLAVLSNGTDDGLRAVVENAGLTDRFAHLLVADSVRRFKPAREVYALAPAAFGLPAAEILFVSGHEWDVAGASVAGMQTAWLARGETCAPMLGHEPDIEAADLPDLARLIPR